MLRILLVLALLVVSGCAAQSVRPPQSDDPANEGKTEKQLLEDRLGV